MGWLDLPDFLAFEGGTLARTVITYALVSPIFLAIACCVAALMLLDGGSGRDIHRGLAVTGLVLTVDPIWGMVAVLALFLHYFPFSQRHSSGSIDSGSLDSDPEPGDKL